MAVVSTVFLFGGAAQAQTYPPGTGVPRCSPGDANAGIVDPGQSIQFILCGNFDPGSTVNITANGISAGTKPPANDAVTVEGGHRPSAWYGWMVPCRGTLQDCRGSR